MRNRYIIPLLSLLLAVFGCKGPSPMETDSVKFDQTEIFISADAGKGSATLTASGPWRVVGKPSWLSYVKPESGVAGSTELSFGGRFYDGAQAQSGEVRVTCGKAEAVIKITQNPRVSFTVSPAEIVDFPAEGGKAELSVECDFKPMCEGCEWISCSSAVKEAQVYKISLTIAPNPSAARQASLRVHDEAGSYEQFVKISQKTNTVLAQKTALEAIYKDCGGVSWTKSDNWCTDKPVSTWYGVGVDASGHITSLDLCNNNLSGALPDRVTDLVYLKELYLYGNRLEGSLPKGMRLMPGWSGFNAAKHIYPQQSGFGLRSVDSEVAQYQKASHGKGIDIVILGDAFDRSALMLGTGFDALVEKTIDAIFALEPMKSCREYFNVYAVSAESSVSEIGTKPDNTAFGTYFTSADFTVVTMTTSWDKVFQYAGKAPVTDLRNSMVVLLANTRRFGGTTLSWDDGRRLSIVPDFQGGAASTEAQYGFAGLVQHEAVGHAFGHFDEEYHTNGSTAPASFASELAVKHSKGWSLNISTESQLSKTPWSALAASGAYPQLGAYEGAGNYSYGVYRSEKDCCMVDNRPYFSAWCRYLLYKRIRTLSDEDSSIESFINFERN
ncbi:MAG: M64 family metallo-endopeptidase [Bacteroidales bacterium]|nr:M64 family metallo-endopeptidase [Bacteroidales bacterium]